MIYKLNIWKTKSDGTIAYKNPIIINNKAQLINILQKNRNDFIENNFENNNLLEYCTDDKYIKLWFDVDMIKIEIDKLYDKLTEFFNLIDELLGKKINRNSYYIYYKKIPNSNITHSLRIINWYYKITYENNMNLCRNLIDNKNNSVISKNLDCRVYHKERQIQLPYNSKIKNDKYEKHKNIYGDLKTDDSKNHFFVDYNYKQMVQAKELTKKNYNKQQTINVLNYLISYIGNCKEELVYMGINNIENFDYKVADGNKVLHKREKILLEKENIINFLIKYLHKKIYEEKYSKKWIGLIKLLKPLNLLNIQELLIHSSKNADKIEYTIERNNNFYNKLNYSNPDENFIVKYYNNSIEIICKYLNEFQDTYEFYTNDFSSIIYDLGRWISYKFNICDIDLDFKFIYKILEKYKDFTENQFRKNKYLINFKINEIYFNYKTGYLYISNTNDIKLFNYYVENQYSHKDQDVNNNFDIVEDKLITDENELNKNILKEVNDFIEYKTEVLVMEMKWGTGKTYHITKRILKNIFKNQINKKVNDYNNINNNLAELIDLENLAKNLKRQIIVSPNNSLNIKEQQELLKEDGNCFINHIAIIKLKDEISGLYSTGAEYNENKEEKLKLKKLQKRFMCRYLNIITSLQSIDNLDITDSASVDTIYLDEFNTLLNNFNLNGKTFKGRKQEGEHYIQKIEYNMNYLIKLCKLAKRIIILDADIDFMKLNWFLKTIGKEQDTKKIKVNYNKFVEEQYKINVYDTEFSLEEQLLRKDYAISTSVKREICCVSKNKAIDIFKSLICECFDDDYKLINFSNKSIGLLDGDGFNYFNTADINSSILSNKLFEYEITDELSNSNKELVRCKIDCKFLKIVENNNLIKCDKLAVQKKEELLNNYEDSIVNIYKFTDFIRTPTIKCGISFNSCYFNEVFVFIYIGILNIQ